MAMADADGFPLVVDLEDNNVPKLKNKLLKYFQSKKRSNGGECQIQYEDGSGTATLRFRTEEDRTRVVAKETHQLPLEEGLLNVTVRFPGKRPKLTTTASNKQIHSGGRPAEEIQVEAASREEPAEEPALCSTSAVLENVPQDMSKDFLKMLVENICKKFQSPMNTQHEFSLEILSDLCSAVVTFSSGKENNEFITSCQTNRMFLSKNLSVRPLEVTAKVKVEDISNISSDVLQVYFEKDGLEVEQITQDEEEESAVISFKMAADVQGIIKKKHLIRETPVKVFPFYDSLGSALYGKDRPTLKLPAAFSESIDPTISTYLHKKQEAAQMVCSPFAALFCKVDLLSSSVSFSPLPTLLQQKGVKAKDIKEWKHSVQQAFAQVLSGFKTLRLQPPLPAWEEFEAQIREVVVDKAVEVISDKAEGALSVIGFVDDVTRLEPTCNELMSKIEKRVLRENTSITHEVMISKVIYQFLCQDGLADQLKDVYPELKIAFQDKMILHGLQHEILEAANLVVSRALAVKQRKFQLDDSLLQFLKDEDEENLTKNVFTSNGIHAAVERVATGLNILAVSDNTLTEAQDQLKQVLISQYIDVEDGNVLKNPQWQNLVKCLEKGTNTPSKKFAITLSSAGQPERVTVAGYKDSVIPVSKKIEEHLYKYSQVDEAFPVKSDCIVRYIETQSKTGIYKVKDTVKMYFGKESFNFIGPREDVMNCQSMFDALMSSVYFEEYQLSKPGAKEFFQENEAMYVSALRNNTGCLVQLMDESGSGQNDLHPSKPIYQLQTSDGIDIVVCKDDLCSYPVDAVVINSNENLKLDGGIAGAFAAAAGSCLQEECNTILLQRGQLKPGDSVITGAGGQLHCKKVIHVVGPQYDQSNHQRTVGQLRRAVKGSLELAEMNGCLSLAISAICANMGFPLNLCADTIIKAMKEHCDDRFGENTLKQIHFVSTNDRAVHALETAVRDKFGNHGITYSQQSGPDKQKTKHQPNSSKLLKTNVGLSIQLVEGNIQDATTEVIVNVVGTELDLGKGAVSKAVLGAAGPQLQLLVSEERKTGNFGDVIVTGGCKLKSNVVFHAVVPPWDNQGNAHKMLRGIVEDCLNEAHKRGLTSITFPAIGTGNLDFPKDLAASVMIEEVLKFKKQPSGLKTVVIVVYPKDRETIQVFKDELKKRLSTTQSVPAPLKTQSSLFSKVTSASGMHEMTIGHVSVQVLSGDITKETTDVIVNSSNPSFDLKTGVSKAILDAAGPTVEHECTILGGQPNTGMIMTKPGNLKCQKILHLPGRNDPQDIQLAVEAALVLVEQNRYTSISFPALGTGQGNAQAGQVADAMLDAVVDLVAQSAQSCLKVVRIVIFQPAMLKDFLSRMEKKAGSDKQNSSFFGNIHGKLKGVVAYLSGGNAATKVTPQKDKNLVLDELQIKSACFHICGSSQAQVNKAITWIDELISNDYVETPITDRMILNLSHADYQDIGVIQSTMNVSVKINDERTSITLEGLTKNVHKANIEIQNMLKKIRDDEDIRKILESIEWQYQLQGVQFQSFDSTTNFLLEQANQNNQPCVDVDIRGRVYTVNMPDGPATDVQGNTVEIRRHDMQKDQDAINLPQHWDPMPSGSTCHTVPITPGTQEYNDVVQLFQATCQQTVIKIDRIQNASLWKSLQIKKQDMDMMNGHQNNEKRLFHGACHTSITAINQHGFNRSYAGKNAAYYGNGSYFAVNASYSADDTYSKPDAQGQKCMYLCRVLTGDYTTGTSGMVVPPTKKSSILQYDSVVNDLNNIQMFIIFRDTQAYPEYLITFK